MESQHATFAEWLRAAMREKRVSSRDLAEAIGVGQKQVVAWRAGRSEPIPATLERLASDDGLRALRLRAWEGFVRVSSEIFNVARKLDPASHALAQLRLARTTRT